jgi:hypothetical protein
MALPHELNSEHKSLLNDVATTLAVCSRALLKAERDNSSALARDLRVAVEALSLIEAELSGKRPARSKPQRSAMFIRYALDENDRLVMSESLRDEVVRIEDRYARM